MSGQRPKAAQVETAGTDFIPVIARTGRVRDLFTMFLSANVAQLYIVVGATLLFLGVDMWAAIVVVVVANLLIFLMGWLAATGTVSGVPASVIMRSFLGVRGGKLFGAGTVFLLSILVTAVNLVIGTFAATALLVESGIDAGLAQLLMFVVFAGIVVLLVFFGYHMIVRMSGILTLLIAVVFVILFGFVVVKAQPWAYVIPAGGTPVVAVVGALTLCIAMPLSWGGSADYARYLPQDTPKTRVVSAVGWGAYVPLVVLEIIGVLAASVTDMTDPIQGLARLVPDFMRVPLMLAIVAGAIMNVVLTMYTASLGLQATGIRMSRNTTVAVAAALSVAAAAYALFFATGFLDALQLAMTILGAVATPLVTIYFVDSIQRRMIYDGQVLSKETSDSPYWYSNGFRVPGVTALLTGAILAVLSLSTTSYVGPIAALFGGLDLSIPVGAGVSLLLFLVLSRMPSYHSSMPAAITPSTRQESAQ